MYVISVDDGVRCAQMSHTFQVKHFECVKTCTDRADVLFHSFQRIILMFTVIKYETSDK